MVSRKAVWLIAVFMVCSAYHASATHLVGGNIGYENLGPDNLNPGNSIFRITFEAYLDCNAPAWGTTFPEGSINIGIYSGSLSSTSLTNVTTQTLNLVSTSVVQPNLPSNCTFSSNACIALSSYEGIVSLSPNIQGYHIIYDRCCRPGSVLNVNNAGDESLTYHTYIPIAGVQFQVNDTPQFNDTLVSYICVGDTITISNTATDPDGDSLVYSLEVPHDGLTSPAFPAINNYGFFTWDPYPYPIPAITYAGGYSLQNQFGIGGYNAINATTGVTEFSATAVGNYAAAVEIKEYRNQNLISVTRRNIQLLAVNCPPNDLPAQDTANLPPNTGGTAFTIDAGDTLCFDITYSDAEGDTIHLAIGGSIFDANQTNPPATVISPLSADSTVTSQFCWNTTCALGSTVPYLFTATIEDEGCPPKTTIETFSINVVPFTGPDSISGPIPACGSDTATYFITGEPGGVYNWTVTGGLIQSGQGTPSIQVLWGAGTSGTIAVTSTSANGCPGNSLAASVPLSNVFADAGNDGSICVGDTFLLGGSPTSPAATSVVWMPNADLNNDTINNPVFSGLDTTIYFLQVTDSIGCIARDTVTVAVNPNPVPNIPAQEFICPGFNKVITANGGGTYQWAPTNGVSNPTISNPIFSPAVTTSYVVTVTSTAGCVTLDSVTVFVQGEVPTNAGLDTAICEGDTISLGGSPTSPGTDVTFQWSPSSSLSDDTLANPLAFPTSQQTYIVLTQVDTCAGADTVTVSILPPPSLVVNNDTAICIGDTAQLTASGADLYTWSPGFSLLDSNINNPLAIPQVPTMYRVTGTNTNGCEGFDSVFVHVQQFPIADAGGDTIDGCENQTVQLGGSPTGPSQATYSWTNASLLSDDSVANPLATVDSTALFYVSVTDSVGCVSTDSTRVIIFKGFIRGDSAVCQNDSIQLTTSYQFANGIPTYLWSPASSVSDSTAPSPIAQFSSPTLFTVIMTAPSGCTDTASVFVDALEPGLPSFDLETTVGCAGIEATFINTSTNATDFLWDIDNGRFVTDLESPSYVFAYGSEPIVSLEASSQEGCSLEIVRPFDFGSFSSLFQFAQPNVFSPNGDGVNDYLEIPLGNNLGNCTEFAVFNRWGHQVFTAEGNNFSWNGRDFSGQELPEGTYFYVIEVRETVYRGSIQLYR